MYHSCGHKPKGATVRRAPRGSTQTDVPPQHFCDQMANTNAANAIMLERVKKEFSAEYNVKPRDPFATTLASLVGGLSDEGRAPAPAAPKAASKLSRAKPPRAGKLLTAIPARAAAAGPRAADEPPEKR